MHANRLAYYKVLDSDGKTILDIQDDNEVSVDEAVNRLRDTLENLTGLITVVLSDKPKKDKGAGGAINDLKITIKLTEDGSSKGITGHEMGNDIIRNSIAKEYEAKMETLQEKHKNEVERLKMEHANEKKFADLHEKIKELKDGDYLDKVLPMISGIFGAPPVAPGINGIPPGGETVEMPQHPHITGPADPNGKARMVNAINRLLKVDQNFIEHLELLANLSESNPMVYQIAIQKLKNI